MNSRKDRILGYDVARALAILGMVLVNFKVAKASPARPVGVGHASPDELIPVRLRGASLGRGYGNRTTPLWDHGSVGAVR